MILLTKPTKLSTCMSYSEIMSVRCHCWLMTRVDHWLWTYAAQLSQVYNFDEGSDHF